MNGILIILFRKDLQAPNDSKNQMTPEIHLHGVPSCVPF
jgi:hypothetical protein